ncbi:hypothetical protein TNCV_431211 [Trichonephila clavipes]|nr:hypothetical protein TNCV_431211 [Trichonephila clavipes]
MWSLRRKVTPRTDTILIRKSKINRSKARPDLRRDVLENGIEVRVPQLYRKEFWNLAVRPHDREKAISSSEVDKKTFIICRKIPTLDC